MQNFFDYYNLFMRNGSKNKILRVEIWHIFQVLRTNNFGALVIRINHVTCSLKLSTYYFVISMKRLYMGI